MKQQVQAPPAPPQKPKKKKRRAVLLILLLCWWLQNYTLKTTRETIYSSHVHTPVTIVLLSDLHASALGIDENRMLHAIAKENPDLVLVLGDMYTKSERDTSRERAEDFLRQLGAQQKNVYMVIGEHDRSVEYIRNVEASGISVLSYEQDSLRVGETTLALYGIDNAYFSNTFDLSHAFAKPDSDSFSILLSHIPNYDAYAAFGTDLTVCGDTHGGIMRLPFVGPLQYQGNWFPKLTQSDQPIYDKGLYPYAGGRMFVTSGVGNYPAFPMRFANRPEIAVLTLMPATT